MDGSVLSKNFDIATALGGTLGVCVDTETVFRDGFSLLGLGT